MTIDWRRDYDTIIGKRHRIMERDPDPNSHGITPKGYPKDRSLWRIRNDIDYRRNSNG